MRNVGLSLISFGLTGAVVANAYYQKKQFYPSVVYITKSNSSMAVIYLQALIMIILAGKLVKKIFFGQLRAAEFEHLMERAWYAVTETCLAFTVFKDDFSINFVALFMLLLFLKVFHWLTEDRVDFMERSPMISYLFHLRIISLLTILGALDTYFVYGAYHTTTTKGASVMIVFGFEYAILLTMVINIVIKYLLHTIDLNREIFWESKDVFFLYMELVMSFVKAIMYIAFVLIMMKVYTLPLFAFRPMYYAARSFRKALKDVINSRRAIHHLNNSFPDATSEEIAQADNVCIICREEMQSGSKKLPCNHIFHTSCLRSWFQRHQTCPTCRTSILDHGSQPSSTQQAPAPPQPPGGAGLPGNQPNAMPQFAFPFQHMQFGFQPPPNQPGQTPNAAGGGVPPQPTGGIPTTSSSSQPFSSGTIPNAQGIPMFPGFPPMPMMPPFLPGAMPFMAYNVPPPVPPANFSGLSSEQLQQMETNAREGVEARLRCLQNIQLLLDAATLMLQQYSVSATNANLMNADTVSPPSEGTSQRGPSTSHDKQGSQTAEPSGEQNIAGSSSSGLNFVPPTPGDQQSTSSSSSSSFNQSNQHPPPPSTSDLGSHTRVTSNETDEQREIRLRRLQKFEGSSSPTL